MITSETTAASATLSATPARERSLAEVKAEIIRRAGRINPFEGISRDEAGQIVNQGQAREIAAPTLFANPVHRGRKMSLNTVFHFF
jgi:hypothetical protein